MTRRMIHRLSTAFAATFFLIAASSASAQSDSRGPFLELFGARVQPTDSDANFHTESYGLRGGYRFTNVWALEGSLARLNEDVDIWFGDLSAKAYAFHSERFEIYALGGAGQYRVESDSTETTVHVGIGAEIGLGRRAYVRPEIRGRWFTKELRADEGLVDYSLGFGWRF
jgi:hypothetical protein